MLDDSQTGSVCFCISLAHAAGHRRSHRRFLKTCMGIGKWEWRWKSSMWRRMMNRSLAVHSWMAQCRAASTDQLHANWIMWPLWCPLAFMLWRCQCHNEPNIPYEKSTLPCNLFLFYRMILKLAKGPNAFTALKRAGFVVEWSVVSYRTRGFTINEL